MAIGWTPKNTHVLPPGRRGFTDAKAPAPDVIRPGTYGDGQPRMGTPSSNEHNSAAANAGYLDASARAHRAAEGSQPYPTTSNPKVTSKAVRRYGVDGRELKDATYRSTGSQPAPEQHDSLPPSLPQRSYTERLPPGGISRRVGFLGDGKPAVPVTSHEITTRRHGSDGIHDPAKSTDNAPGMSHSASGGRFGNPQARPAPAPRRGVGTGDSGPLDRKSYTGGKYQGDK